MDSLEPAGCEGEKGKSAELFSRARLKGGPAGNTCRTVCGASRRCAICCRVKRLRRIVLSVGACLYRLFLFPKIR